MKGRILSEDSRLYREGIVVGCLTLPAGSWVGYWVGGWTGLLAYQAGFFVRQVWTQYMMRRARAEATRVAAQQLSSAVQQRRLNGLLSGSLHQKTAS
jgi:hypothetical protein